MEVGKRPLYKRWWFISFVVFILLGIAGSFLSDTSPTERVEAEIAKKAQEEQTKEEKASVQTEVDLEEKTTQEAQEKVNLTLTQEIQQEEELDKKAQKAIDVAMKKFQCKEEELTIEKLKDNAFVVNLVADMGSGTISTLDSVLIVNGKIISHMYDANSTVEAYWGKVEEERTGVKAVTVDSKKRINPLEVKWNVKDTDIATNGNLKIAGDILHKMSLEDIKNANWIQDAPVNVYKAPWKYYGQMMAVQGTVMNVMEYPPGSDISKLVAKGRSCVEVSMVSEDETFGISFILAGGGSSIQVNENITAYGLPVGYVTGINILGGQVTSLVLVGIEK